MRRYLTLAALLFILPAFAGAQDDDVRFYGPSWADSSGRDGKGGVSITSVGDKHNIVLRKDPCKVKIDSDTNVNHPQWIIFQDNGDGDALSFEYTWITTPTDKFWGKLWAGGGIAFNQSWNAINISEAKYLVMSVKNSHPDHPVDLNLALIGTGDSSTGEVKATEYAVGRKLGRDWTKVMIPLAAIPNISRFNLAATQQIRIGLSGTYPENTKGFIHISNIYFSAANLVTPVDNLGWTEVPGGAMVVWDKDPAETLTGFKVTVDGKEVGAQRPDMRRVKIPAKLLPGKSHVIGVASVREKQVSDFQSVTITLGRNQALSASVLVSGTPGRPISPYIYGFNGWSLDAQSMKKLGATLNRFGGNAATNYNWKDDAMNRGNDWYFLNTAEGKSTATEADKSYYKFTQEAFKAGADAMMTIPIIGWVAKRPVEGGPRLCSYPLSLFPSQEANDNGCGNGYLPGKKEMKDMIWGNDPNYNYIPSTPEFQKEWVQTLVKNFGTASGKGVKFYSMDNETGLWHWNHRDVRPKGVGAEELVELNAKYAAMVKSVDPSAQIVGMVSWGVKELAGSAWDYMPGGPVGYKLGEGGMKDDQKWTDRKAHGNLPQAVYFLKEMKKRSDKAGVRLLDYFDNHGFPEVWGTNAKGEKVNVMGDFAYDPIMTPKQFDAFRIFWDDTFVSPDSWCYAYGNAPDLWTPWVGLIPKLKKYIAENYPGTKLAMTEYYPASKSHYHGGLLQALNLGIFTREGMDMACDWGGVDQVNYVYYGHMLFSNYDGRGTKVLGNYVGSSSSSGDLYSFASKQGTVTRVVLINKNHDADINTTITLPAAATTYSTYVLSETLGKRILEIGAPKEFTASPTLKLKVPAFSALLVVAK
jgi:hypothetical protein